MKNRNKGYTFKHFIKGIPEMRFIDLVACLKYRRFLVGMYGQNRVSGVIVQVEL